MKVLLVGNPNTGKTTLLNSLTKGFEHTGNWHGVTVTEKSRFFEINNKQIEVVDLPGLYSLNALSGEEQVAIDYIFKQKYDLILCTADCQSLKKNLYLLVELLLAGKNNIMLAVNTMGKKNLIYDLGLLEKTLGVQVLSFNFAKANECEKLKQQMLHLKANNANIFKEVFSLETQKEVLYIKTKTGLSEYEILKIFEKNNYFFKKINKNNFIFNFFKNNKLNEEILIKEKYLFIDKILPKSLEKKQFNFQLMDKIFLNKYLALPCFLMVMLLVFYLTFFSVGAYLSDLLSNLIQVQLGQTVVDALKSVCDVPWVISLVEDGIFAGALSLVAFLPQVAILFLCLAIMEDTGYFSRIAFIFEDIFNQFGLSGKSVYTLLMGFGCSASACLTARTMETKALKVKTALVTPYMSCSAKLPIYTVLGGAFFGASNVWVILLLYFLGVISGLFISLILDKILHQKQRSQFLMEFPPYRFVSIKKVCITAGLNMKMFLVKVFTIFVSMSLILWCLSSFSFNFVFVGAGSEHSMLSGLGKIFAPIFAPLGFNSAGAVGALFAGLVAKEVVVSAIAIFNGSFSTSLADSLKNPDSAVYFTGASALSYLGFTLLYPPCIATMAVLKKEVGIKWMLVGISLQIIMAYVISFMLFSLYRLAESIGFMNMAMMVIAVFSICLSVFYIVSMIKQKKICKVCGKCKF